MGKVILQTNSPAGLIHNIIPFCCCRVSISQLVLFSRSRQPSPSGVIDLQKGLVILLCRPHHIQHRHAQALLLRLMSGANLHLAVYEVASPLGGNSEQNT